MILINFNLINLKLMKAKYNINNNSIIEDLLFDKIVKINQLNNRKMLNIDNLL